MNRKSVIELPASIEAFISNTYQLCGTKESSWVKEGTGGESGIPAQKMHTSNIYMLEVTSRLYRGKGNGYMPTMYAIGQSTHYVENYYETKDGKFVMEIVTKEEAEEKGYVFRLGLRSILGSEEKLRMAEADSKRLGICFEKGRLNLSKYGDNPVFRKFIEEHEQNKMAPNFAENRDPQRLRLFLFEPLIQEKKAAKGKIVANFDDDVKAMNYVGKLRKVHESGSVTYNELALNAILSIIQEGLSLEAGEVVQKFEIAAKAAKVDGGRFLKMINDATGEYRIEVGKAESLKVLDYAGVEAKMGVGAKKTTVYTFDKDTNKEDMLNELVLYFIGDAKGVADYKELRRLTESAKIAALK